MSKDKTVAGMPKDKRQEIMWGRGNFDPNFFGPNLIAEALHQVLHTADLKHMRNFTALANAFAQVYTTSWQRGIRGTSSISNKDFPKQQYSLEKSCSVGSYNEKFGLTSRDVSSDIVPLDEWLSPKEWDERQRQRRADSDCLYGPGLPLQQVAILRARQVLLTHNKHLVIFNVNLYPSGGLWPNVLTPVKFSLGQAELYKVYDLRKESIKRFCEEEGSRAGVAVLKGLTLHLQSSNYQVLQELQNNQKAQSVAEGLLSRIRHPDFV